MIQNVGTTHGTTAMEIGSVYPINTLKGTISSLQADLSSASQNSHVRQ